MKATEKYVSKAEISTYSYFIQQNSSTFVALAMSTTLAISLCLNLKVFSNPSASKYLQTHYKQIMEHYVGAYKNTSTRYMYFCFPFVGCNFLWWYQSKIDIDCYWLLWIIGLSIDYACMKIFRKFKIEKKIDRKKSTGNTYTHTTTKIQQH